MGRITGSKYVAVNTASRLVKAYTPCTVKYAVGSYVGVPCHVLDHSTHIYIYSRSHFETCVSIFLGASRRASLVYLCAGSYTT